MKKKKGYSYGIIPILKGNKEPLFLLVRHTQGHWAFPKGRMEEGENEIETATRELKEEVGIENVIIDTRHIMINKFTFKFEGSLILKEVGYFPGMVEDQPVKIQEEEISDYKWATYKEAMSLIEFKNLRKITAKIHHLLVSDELFKERNVYVASSEPKK